MIKPSEFIHLFKTVLATYDANNMDKRVFSMLMWLVTRPDSYCVEHDLTEDVVARLHDMPWCDQVGKVIVVDFHIMVKDGVHLKNVESFEDGSVPVCSTVEALTPEGEHFSLTRIASAHLRNVIETVADERGLTMAKMADTSFEFSLSDDALGMIIERDGEGEDDVERQVNEFMSQLDNVFGTWKGGEEDG